MRLETAVQRLMREAGRGLAERGLQTGVDGWLDLESEWVMNVVQMGLGHLILMLMALLGAGVAAVRMLEGAGCFPGPGAMVPQADLRRRGWGVRHRGTGDAGWCPFCLNAVL